MEATAWGYDPPASAIQAPAAKAPATQKPALDTPKKPDTPKKDAPKQIDNPLRNARVGEWVTWRHVLQGQEAKSTLRVVEVRADAVVLESAIRYGDTELKSGALERPRDPFLSLAGAGTLTVTEETLSVNDQKLACVVVTRTHRGRIDKRWYCPQVPVNGLVRHERAGTVVRELIAWGDA